MRKLLLLLMCVLSINTISIGGTSKALIDVKQVSTFYPNTRYDKSYYVANRYVNGVWCYAYWNSVYVYNGTTAYSLNAFGGFNSVVVNRYYYFVWVPSN